MLLEAPGVTNTRFVLDALMLIGAAGAAVGGARAAGVPHDAEFLAYLFAPLTMLLLGLRGMYRPAQHLSLLDGAAHILGATSAGAMVLLGLQALSEPASRPGPLVARAWLFGTLFVAGGRLMLALAQRRARATGAIGRRTLIVGAGRVGAQVERRLRSQPELGLRPIGYVDFVAPPEELVPGRTAPLLGHPEDIARIVQETHARHVVIAFPSARGADRVMVPWIRQFEQLGLTVSVVPRLFEMVNMRVEVQHLGGVPLLALRSVNPKGWQFAIKHGLDRLTAAVALVVLSPIIGITALAVRLSSPGPVLYRQRRIGRDGTEFDLLKFRSMLIAPPTPPAAERNRESAPAPPATTDVLGPGGVEGADRRTPIGRFLRKSSLDELPQLWNVLKGEMSLIGPRPERPEFVAEFAGRLERYRDRHRVRSGITGWAQVHGLRGKTSLADRIEWDNYYIENWSLWLDLKILLMTFVAVFRGAE